MQKTPAERPPEEVMWAGPSGERWLANAVRLEETMRPVGVALLDAARLSPGEQVLDVGCGAGSMSLDIAGRVAPGGSVTGIDISPALVAEGTRRAAAARPPVPVQFICTDAARAQLPAGPADCLVSRFGSMFFTDPVAAFSHIHGLLRPGGRMALACWAPLTKNPWMLEVRTILAAHFDFPPQPPRIPGPYAFDEPDYLRGILTQARFADAQWVLWEGMMHVGGPGSSPESAADFLMAALSMAQRALDAPAPLREQVRSQLVERLRAFDSPSGVRMPATVWLTTARA